MLGMMLTRNLDDILYSAPRRPPLDIRRAASEDSSQLPLPSASTADDAQPAPDAARAVDASSPDAAKALKVRSPAPSSGLPCDHYLKHDVQLRWPEGNSARFSKSLSACPLLSRATVSPATKA